MKNHKSVVSLFMLMFVLLMSAVVDAAPTLVSPSPNSIGEIERITLDDPADVYSGGVMVAGGTQMILPRNLLIDLPANRLSLQQIFDQAPAACKALGESGLAKNDRCNGSGSGAIATLSAVYTNAGNVIVGDLFIQKAAESVTGVVTYINYDQGYYRVNGINNDPATGAMVRLNDPGSRHTIQSGAGCAGGPNCSPDPRFTLDPDNYTNTFATGYPVCIPSTVARSFSNPFGTTTTSQANASGIGDYLCPDTNRTATLNEPPVADSRLFAPVKVGDSVLAEGNFETVGGVRFLSAHSSTVQKALSTRNAAGQPDYLFLEEVGYEAPPYQNQRLIALMIGFTTLAPTDVDIWSLHRDPVNNAIHEFPFASVQGCDNVSGGPGSCSSQGLVAAGQNIFKIRYDVDFVKGPEPRLSPCAQLLGSRFASSHPGICSGGATTAKDIAVMSPVPHEIIARTGRKITSAEGSLITIDINGNPATNGEYLFPLGLNLGGLGVAEMSEVNINELNTPIPFEGIPWNLDRRLGPAGCLNDGGCESLGGAPIGSFALDPFPFSGLDPRLQAAGFPNVSYIDPVFSPSTLSSSRNRMFSYVLGTDFGGNATLLPYALGIFPADPPLISIAAAPTPSLFPPVANADSASTSAGVPVLIDVLANDFPVIGLIDPASVNIATAPASGTAQVNANGSILFTPAAGITGTVSFSYTVASFFGGVSQPGQVNVTVTAPGPVNPVLAANDTATTPEDTPVVISVTANDSTLEGALVLNSVALVATPANGSAVANADGTVTYTPNANFFGSNTFSYTVSNGSAVSSAATVTVTVTPVNDPPLAVNDVATVAADTPIAINVIANDSDPEGNLLTTVTIASPPANGTATVNAAGTVTFTGNAVGTETFTYTVTDNLGAQSQPATVSVSVTSASSETVTGIRAQYRASTREWLVQGVINNGTSTSVRLYIGRDFTGPVLGTAPVAADGRWRFQLPGAPDNPQPDATNTISVQGLNGGGSRLAFPLAVR